jgi:hypothetical protein
MTVETTDVQLLQREQEMLRASLQEALGAVNRRARYYRRLNVALILVAVLSGATVTLLGADAARGGTRVAQRVAEGTTGKTPAPLGQGWRNVCAIMAILAFLGTVSTGVNGGLKVTERNVRAFACAGVLDGLLIELPGAASLGRPVLDRTRAELARIRREYAEFFR